MSNSNNNASGGLGFGSILCLIFITLKLIGIITWPWKWVLAPIWIPLLIGVIIGLIWAILK